MKYTASLEYKDDSGTTHFLSKEVDTSVDGALSIYEWLHYLMLNWPRIDPKGVKAAALVESLDGDHCDVYEFNFGV